MLKRTLHPAFGYVIVRNHYVKNDTMIVDATADVRSHIYYVKGNITWTDSITGEPVIDCSAGTYLPNTETPIGIFKGEALADENIFFCTDPKINKNGLPDLKAVCIRDQNDFPAGSKLFLCEGSISIKGKTISAPAQIRMTFDTTVTCIGHPAYGLLYP